MIFKFNIIIFDFFSIYFNIINLLPLKVNKEIRILKILCQIKGRGKFTAVVWLVTK